MLTVVHTKLTAKTEYRDDNKPKFAHFAFKFAGHSELLLVTKGRDHRFRKFYVQRIHKRVTMSVKSINDELHFQAELQAAGVKLVVVDFTATW